jgi:hypothetical protein
VHRCFGQQTFTGVAGRRITCAAVICQPWPPVLLLINLAPIFRYFMKRGVRRNCCSTYSTTDARPPSAPFLWKNRFLQQSVGPSNGSPLRPKTLLHLRSPPAFVSVCQKCVYTLGGSVPHHRRIMHNAHTCTQMSLYIRKFTIPSLFPSPPGWTTTLYVEQSFTWTPQATTQDPSGAFIARDAIIAH